MLRFGLFSLGISAIGVALLLGPAKLVLTGHEGDLLHMVDATLRMAHGERPHLDFMTPIGALGFAPVAGFLALGFKIGKAVFLAETALLALMLPVVWWLAATRFSKGQAYFFASCIVGMMLAVVYGGGAPVISLSMYYNRWGWSLTFLLLATILFKPHRPGGKGWGAPLVIGGGMAALAMLKVTFFVPLVPAVVLILLVQKQGALLLKSLAVGLGVALGLLAWLGVDFFAAYLGDLLAVMRPESARTNTGVPLSDIVASPLRSMTSIILFATLVIFRKSGRMQQGLVVLILAPAFTYITYQNWGNDPKWLLLLVLYIWANLPEAAAKPVFGVPARQGALALIAASLTFIFPSIVSMATSPVRMLMKAASPDISKLELIGGVSDIWLPESRRKTVAGVQAVAGFPPMTPDLPAVKINGFTFPDCQEKKSLVLPFERITRQIDALDGVRGQPVLLADVLGPLWLLGDVARVKGAAPWYYGDASGVANAAYLAVPFCPLKPPLRAAMVSQFQKGGYGLEEVYRSALMVLYAVSKPAE